MNTDYIIRVYGTFKTYDIIVKATKTDSPYTHNKRTYKKLHEVQKGLYKKIKIELYQGTALIDTFNGLI